VLKLGETKPSVMLRSSAAWVAVQHRKNSGKKNLNLIVEYGTAVGSDFLYHNGNVCGQKNRTGYDSGRKRRSIKKRLGCSLSTRRSIASIPTIVATNGQK
jgi:hypothetical protein